MANKLITSVVLVALTIFGCERNYKQENDDILNPKIDSVSNHTSETNPPKTKPEFDIHKFIALTDSLYTSITGLPINLIYKIDTLGSDAYERESYYYPLFSTKQSIIRRISFDPGKRQRELRLWIVEATYKSAFEANQIFSKLRTITGKVNDSTDIIPGLTYSNDYVLKSDSKIIWLNSGCAVSFLNHQKLTRFMLSSYKIENIQDSIWCKCGQPKCSL